MIRALIRVLATALIALGFAIGGGVAVADHLYGRAVADCETYGGRPVAVEDRLAYECATPYGRIRP
jgi:hypothetical protein